MINEKIILPTFLIVGVQKAGTTSIYNYLQAHPQVYMSPVKETNFLERDWEEIEAAQQNKNGIISLEDYAKLFEGVKDEIAIGEASPNYIFNYQSSAERIKKYVPQAQLIIVLRNPIERAYSDYLMHLRDAIGYRPLAEQIKNSAHKSFILRKGFYYEPIKYYLDVFGWEKIKVFFYDDLCQNSQQFMQEMYGYIGVDPNFKVDTSEKVQTAKIPKNQAINNLLQRQNPLRTFAATTLKTMIPLETRQKIRDRLINLNSQSKKEVPLSPEERQQLIELYQEDILKLQDLIDKDLSHWLDGKANK
jgi:hypothetical protein